MAQDLCILNTAGPKKRQAVALRISADATVVYRCRINAYQDTLCCSVSWSYKINMFFKNFKCHKLLFDYKNIVMWHSILEYTALLKPYIE